MKTIADHGPLAGFRSTWVTGHLDHQRALDALEYARAAAGTAVGEDATHQARAAVEHAAARLAQVEAALIGQFNRFCGIG